MSKPLNVAVIGYGFMGKAHANAYRKVNNFYPELEHRRNLACLCARDAAMPSPLSVRRVSNCETRLEF